METRRFDQKRGKKREIEGSDGKLLVNCGKKEKKGREEGKRVKRGKKRRKNGKRERIGGGRWKGERKREGKVGKRRAVGLLHDTANVVGNLPVMSRPPLHEKRPCSNRL